LLEINFQMRIPLDEFEWSYVRSSGPGGQNVNKVASKAVLRWDAQSSPSVPDAVKARLFALYGNRFTSEGVLVLQSQRFRDQERNREDCLEKLRQWLLQAATVPRRRKQTRPTKASKQRRLSAKKRRASAKADRRAPRED
jgi:ribosome-associated protein